MATSSTNSITTTTTGGNVLRITGMASGLDVDGTVTKLLTPDQYKIDAAKSDRQKLQWSQDAYKDIINDVKSLQSAFFDVSSPDTNLLSSSNYSAYAVSASNAAVANATAGVNVQAGNYTVAVTSLATGANFTRAITGSSAITLSSKLTDITGSDGTTIAATDLKNVDSSTPLTLSLDVNGGTANAANGGKTIDISIDNSSGNLTMSDLVNAINAKGSGTIKASYSELTQKLVLTTVATGQNQSIAINASSSAGLTTLFGASTAGQNANLTITTPDGTSVPVTNQTSNNFTIDGMSYNLSSTGTSTLTVSKDNQKVYDKIKSFIDKYNTLVDKIQTKLTEKSDKNYKPLTDAQKATMTQDQINTWESKAKVGILRNDDNLQKLLTDLHQAFATPVTGSSLAIGSYGSSSFGIDTSSTYSSSEEINIVDATKLKNAIANNSDDLMKLFTNVSTSTDDTTKNNESGIFTRIQSIIQDNVGYAGTTYNGAILTKYANAQDSFSTYGDTGLNTLPDQLYAKDALIKQLQTAFADKQTAYYNKFAKLETALTQLNNQSATISSMTSTG